jgi:RNA polymerase sigma-70 factor (ECF subfamily)
MLPERRQERHMNSSKWQSVRDATRQGASHGDDLDCELIWATAAGDEAAFEALHSRYSHRVESFTLRITRRHDLAEEVAHETLTAVWRSAARFRSASRVSTWIFGIARILSLKALRKSHRAVLNMTNNEFEESHDPWLHSEVREWLDAALALLPEEQRAPLERCYRWGQSCQEIADGLDCSINTVKTRMFYGRRKLRQLLPELAGRERMA